MNYKKPEHFGIGSIEALFVTQNYTIQSFDFRLKKLKSIILVFKNFNTKAKVFRLSLSRVIGS